MPRPIKSYFTDYLTEGAIFSLMQSAPWMQENIGHEMDVVYISTWSGIKGATAIFDELMTDDGLDKQKLADVLWTMFGKNWTRLWDAYNAQYDPITNYNIVEKATRELDANRDIDRNIARKGSVQLTGKEDTETSNSRNTTDNGTSTETGSNSKNTTTDVDTTVTETEKGSVNTNENRTTDDKGTVNTTQDTNSTTTEELSSTTTVQHGQTIATNNESDFYAYGFNSEEKVPSNVTIEEGKEVHSGSDVTTVQSTDVTNVNGTVTTNTTTTGNQKVSGTLDTDTNKTITTVTDGTTTVGETEHISDKVVTESSGTETETGKSGTTKSDNTESQETTGDKTTDANKEYEITTRERSGNIGQNTYQELLRQEFELWKWNFYQQVFSDCDRILCLSVFGDCHHMPRYSCTVGCAVICS